jgi:hypothetical protein
MRSLVRFLLSSYPPWWRRRYGEETADLTWQLLEGSSTKRWRVLTSLLFGSLLAWSQIRRAGDYLRPASSPNLWGIVPQGSHRDLFGNRGLWPRSEAELESDEVLLGVLDGVTGHRFIVTMPTLGVVCILVPLIMTLVLGPIRGYSVTWPAMGAVFLLVGLLLARLTKSYYVSVAVTSHGVVIFRRSGFSGRTGKMIERMSAVEPQLVKAGVSMHKVRIGDRTLWLNGKSDPLLYWMSSTLRLSGGHPGPQM